MDANASWKSIFLGNQGSKAPLAPRSVAPTVLSPRTPPIVFKMRYSILIKKGRFQRKPWFPLKEGSWGRAHIRPPSGRANTRGATYGCSTKGVPLLDAEQPNVAPHVTAGGSYAT